MAVLDQPCDQGVAGHPFDRGFPCGIDIRDEDDVGIVEAGAEPVEKMV